jgi:hypothetical protein
MIAEEPADLGQPCPLISVECEIHTGPFAAFHRLRQRSATAEFRGGSSAFYDLGAL